MNSNGSDVRGFLKAKYNWENKYNYKEEYLTCWMVNIYSVFIELIFVMSTGKNHPFQLK